MELSSDNVDELKIKIRSVLQSSQQGVKKSNFLDEYTQLTGEGINVKRLGFKTIGDFMASIPDTVAGRGDTYTAVTTESTEHLEKLIHRQRPPTTYNRSRDTGHPRNNHGARQPVRKYGRNSASSQHQNHKIASGKRFNRHVSSSSGVPTHRNGHYSYNANNKFKPPPPKMPMAVPRLPGRTTPPVNTNSTTTPVNGLRTKVLSILCQAADGLHISALQKRFRSQTGTNIPFAEYGYNSIGDLMLGFMWNNFKCIHSGDFYFAVRSSSRPSNNSGGAVHNNNNNNNNDNNNHHHHHNHRQPARNGNNGPTWGRNGGNPTGPFNNNRHRPVPFRDSSDNKRNTMSRPSETNGSMQNRRFISQHSNNPKGPQNRYIHRNKEQTANGRGQRAILSMCDDNNKEAFINNQQNFNGSSYGETDSLTTTTSSSHYYHHHHHHQGPFQHRLSRSDTTRSEFASDASSSSDYSPSASGSFQKNLKSEANNNTRNRSYSTTSNNSGGGASNSSQPLEDYDYDSPCDEHLSFHSGEESQIFKNTFDPISSGLRFKKGRGCGRGYGLSSYMGERLPGEPRPSERSVALSENWSSTEKLSFQHGNTPIENLIISIRNTSLSDNDDSIIDKQPTTAIDVGCGLGRGRGRTRKTSDPTSTRF